jgi:hypothetical protein
LDVNTSCAKHSGTTGPECTGVHCKQCNSFERCKERVTAKLYQILKSEVIENDLIENTALVGFGRTN